MIGNKIANKIIKVSKNSQQINLVINENDKEIPKERYMSPEEREEVTDSFRLKYWYNNGISKLINLLKNTPNQPS